MELPKLVNRRLDGESVLAAVDLEGDDRVVVTASRVLVYRAEGLLSDESVEACSLDADRLELRSGRRRTTFVLGYVDGRRDFAVPSSRTSEVLSPLLGGLLRAKGVVEADESVRGAYRFSELTLVVTDRRLVRHVGAAVWDEEFEVAPFVDLTGLAFEEGSVGTETTVEVDGYPQRFKIPNDHAGSVRRTLQEAVFAFHDVSSLAELEEQVGGDESDELDESGSTERLDDPDERPFADLTAPELDRDRDRNRNRGSGRESRDERNTEPERTTEAASTADVGADLGVGAEDGSGTDLSADTEREGVTDEALLERLEALEAAVDRQAGLVQRQQATIEKLVEELRHGR
jgi:hypothetical protein